MHACDVGASINYYLQYSGSPNPILNIKALTLPTGMMGGFCVQGFVQGLAQAGVVQHIAYCQGVGRQANPSDGEACTQVLLFAGPKLC